MPQTVRTVVIVGGGTAGWITAGIIAAKHKGDDNDCIQVILVESPNIKPIGVGEGTWPSMRITLQRMGVSETDFIRECAVSYKQGSKFVDWVNGGPGDFYYHPFTAPQGFSEGNLAPHWLRDKHETSFSQAVCYQEYICELGLAPKDFSTPEFSALANYAYHLDAGTFSEFLKKHCVKNLGIRHVLDDVTEINAAENGDIASVSTKEHGELNGDLFVDCTGFSSLLLGEHFGIAHLDKSDILFVNTAIAVQVPYESESSPIASATISTARDAGWIWDIGLSSRRGVGYVYSSDHTTDTAAEAQLLEYLRHTAPKADELITRKIAIRPGQREKFWERNCVAVGLSAGFVEPLEASALVLVELSAQMIADHFPVTRAAMDIIADRFNERFQYRWNRVIDFLKLHYVLSARADGEFWRDNRRAETIPDSLQELLTLWKVQHPQHDEFAQIQELFGESSYQYVLYGMGFNTAASHLGSSDAAKEFATKQFKETERIRKKLVSMLPSNRELLDKISGRFDGESKQEDGPRAIQPVALDSNTHQKTRVITSTGAEYGDNVCMVSVVPGEFRELAAHYPIFITKNANTGQFDLSAIFGFEEGENLFLDGNEWQAEYIPLHIQRQPFLISFPSDAQNADSSSGVISVDMNSPRVQEQKGEALFLEQGVASDYLERQESLLAELVAGTGASRDFIAQLIEIDLIEAVGLRIQFADGQKFQFEALFSVSEEKEQTIPRSALRAFHQNGYLELIHIMRASFAHMPTLIRMKNKRLMESSQTFV